MNTAILAALAHAPALSKTQMRGVIDVVARNAPTLLVEIASRQDLDPDLRLDMVRLAPSSLLSEDLLECWPPSTALIDAAAESHGSSPGLILKCGTQGWMDRATALAASLAPDQVNHLVVRWENELGFIPPGLRAVLIDAVLTEKSPPPVLSEMPRREMDETLERLETERDLRAQQAWQLLEPAPELWLKLALESTHAMLIRRILLARPDQLADEVLLACLPEVTCDRLRRDGDVFASVRLSNAADYARRWPRLRDIASEELRRVVREAVEDGWAPASSCGGTDWNGITALAELSEEPALLAEAVEATRQARQPNSSLQAHEKATPWLKERAQAVAALTANPHTSRQDLITLLPVLDETAVATMQQHSDDELTAACRDRLHQLRQEQIDRQLQSVHIPPDNELAKLNNPAAELTKYLRYLRGRAAQREAVCTDLLRSRFTTRELLRALPARRVLDSQEQAAVAASMIAEVCADDATRWSALSSHLQTRPPMTVTFGSWLEPLEMWDADSNAAM